MILFTDEQNPSRSVPPPPSPEPPAPKTELVIEVTPVKTATEPEIEVYQITMSLSGGAVDEWSEVKGSRELAQALLQGARMAADLISAVHLKVPEVAPYDQPTQATTDITGRRPSYPAR